MTFSPPPRPTQQPHVEQQVQHVARQVQQVQQVQQPEEEARRVALNRAKKLRRLEERATRRRETQRYLKEQRKRERKEERGVSREVAREVAKKRAKKREVPLTQVELIQAARDQHHAMQQQQQQPPQQQRQRPRHSGYDVDDVNRREGFVKKATTKKATTNVEYTKYTQYTPRKEAAAATHSNGGPSNRKMVRLALKHRCLAGAHVAQTQMEVLHCLERCTATSQFVILFGKLNGNKFRGLYAVAPKQQGGVGSYKLFGTGPGRIKPEMIAKYYRYNSGSKCFVELKGAKHTTSTTCGVQLLPGCYQRGKGGGGGGMPLFMRGGE